MVAHTTNYHSTPEVMDDGEVLAHHPHHSHLEMVVACLQGCSILEQSFNAFSEEARETYSKLPCYDCEYLSGSYENVPGCYISNEKKGE